MDVPAAAVAVGRIDMTDLNPYFVALSGVLDEVEFCYRDVQLLDFRRNAVTPVAQCLLPSYPEAPNSNAYRPFERSLNCSKLGALAAPAADPPSGYTDQLIVVDGAAGTVEQVALPRGADRLQPGTGASRDLRLRRPDGSGAFDLYTPSGAFAELQGPAPLPEPLDDALTRTVARVVNFGDGYRMRFLASESEATPPLPNLESSVAVLFGPAARRLQTMRFPPDWRPLIPPQQVNAQGVAVGAPAAPAQVGFGPDSTAYVLVESADGARQGIAAFSASLPAAESALGAAPVSPPASSVSVARRVIELPAGVFAATCAPQVRWLRLGLTQQLAIVAAGERLTEAALPRDGKTCGGDRLAVFNPDDDSVAVHQAPGSLDNATPGAVRDFLYFGDAGRAVALEAPEKLYVFDAVQEQFAAVEFPEGVGITVNALTQALPGQARLVALATGGPPRTNRAGNILPPFPGNRGLLVVDLAAAAAQHLALPPGYVRILPGNLRLIQEGRRGFGLIPMLGRAFARAAQPGGGPGNPAQTRMLTWDTETGHAAEVPVPAGGYTVVQARPQGGAARPLIWDYRPKTASFAFGVFNQAGDAISIGVVGP